ncbi:MAG: hypothetical protein IKW28_06070 [Lachnospiraceae bacterium]|nr:hypothetical protein [Lachnospiraceae bacterium]
MNKDDAAVLKNVQKNIEMAMKAIETVEPKVQEKNLALLLADTNKRYALLHNKVVSKMVEEKIQPEKSSTMENMMLVGGITGNTLLNTSTGHLAELMIKGSNMGITDLNKTLNHHGEASKEAKEIVEELLEMEKYNLEEYKKYL